MLVAVFTFPLILDPGRLLPKHKDPLMYGWTMVSNARRLLSVPLAVFHGNTFYPHGNTIAHTDLLLTPTLIAGPIYLLTGNPVLAYNLSLLIWWALSGWAMYVLALALFRSHVAAIIASLAFTLCPYRTDYYLEFQMQLAFPIPLALLCFIRFLESHRWRHLAGVVLLLWVEALAAMYYAIILGLCLGVVAVLFWILRPGTLSWTMARRLVVGGLVLGVILTPFVVPYVQNRRELGLERGLGQPAKHSADILTYFETGHTRLYRFRPTNHIAETSFFMGFVALALAGVGSLARQAPAGPERSPVRRRVTRLLTAGIVGAVLTLVVELIWRDALRAAGLPVPRPMRVLDIILALGLLRIAVEGWWAVKDGEHRHPLGERELRWVSLFLIALFFVLSLGPLIRFGGRELGRGLYFHLYPYLLPLHAMRITTRIGVIVVLGVSLLAGLGMKYLVARLPGARSRVAVTGLVVTLLLAEYAPFPLRYVRVDWSQRPPVYAALAADPDDVAVLEWPQGLEDPDDYYTFMSIGHWKRLVNGASGFSPTFPRLTRDISARLSEPDSPLRSFPSPEARRYLLGIHPLRYVIVHNGLLGADEQRKWQKLRDQPWARYVGRFGDDDLYRLSGDVTGGRIEKLFSWDYARTRREIAFEARPLGPDTGRRWVEVELNGRLLGRADVGAGPTVVGMPLTGELYRSAPNVITITWRYELPEGTPGRAIGRTGVLSAADLHVVSGGLEAGDRASVLVNGGEYAQDRRGYNVVAIDPAAGRVLWSDVFDTFGSADESRRLAAAIDRVATGTVVAAAVADDGSGQLTDVAVAALRSLGGSEDIRGRYRVSHLLIGVKGAPPGTAIERSGYALLMATVGTPPERIGLEVRGFALR